MIYFYLQNNKKNSNILGDYSIEKENFYFTNNTKKKFILNKLIINIEDNGNFNSNTYGNMEKLQNGIALLLNNEFIFSNIKSNKEWLNYPCIVEKHNFDVGKTNLRIIFNFMDLDLNIDPYKKLSIVVNDNFTNLLNHSFLIEGRYK